MEYPDYVAYASIGRKIKPTSAEKGRKDRTHHSLNHRARFHSLRDSTMNSPEPLRHLPTLQTAPSLPAARDITAPNQTSENKNYPKPDSPPQDMKPKPEYSQIINEIKKEIYRAKLVPHALACMHPASLVTRRHATPQKFPKWDFS
ncbi:MAG: hypothetical protein Q9226_002564 [Calogaya cf. arnoldii]